MNNINTEIKTSQTNNTDIDTDKPKTVSWVTYTVRHDDTLYKIATKYNISVDELKSNNNLTDDIILIGQILKVKTK